MREGEINWGASEAKHRADTLPKLVGLGVTIVQTSPCGLYLAAATAPPVKVEGKVEQPI